MSLKIIKESKKEKLNRNHVELNSNLNRIRMHIETEREILNKLVEKALEMGISLSRDKKTIAHNRKLDMLIVEYNKLLESETND